MPIVAGDKIDGDQVQFEDAITRRSYTWAISKVAKEIFEQEFEVVGVSTAKNVTDNNPVNFISSIDPLPEKYRADLEYKIRRVKWLTKNDASRGLRDVIAALIPKFAESEKEKRPLPSALTAMNWLRKWEEFGHNPAALVSKNFQRKRSTEFPQVIEDEMAKVLINDYLIRSRPPLDRAFTVLRRNLQRLVKGHSV